MNDQNFVISVLTLEEFGATGNKVSSAPCFPNGIPGTGCTCGSLQLCELSLCVLSMLQGVGL